MDINANDYKDVYTELGIKLDELGCIMLDTVPLKVSDLIEEDELYFRQSAGRFWINGIVSEDVPHVTLLFGLMQSGQQWKPYVDKVLEGWSMSTVTIDRVDFFESPYDDEAYFCLVAHLKMTPEFIEANSRLRFLPHIDTYPEYRAHISLAYIKKDEQLRDKLLRELNGRFAGKQVQTKDLNYGR